MARNAHALWGDAAGAVLSAAAAVAAAAAVQVLAGGPASDAVATAAGRFVPSATTNSDTGDPDRIVRAAAADGAVTRDEIVAALTASGITVTDDPDDDPLAARVTTTPVPDSDATVVTVVTGTRCRSWHVTPRTSDGVAGPLGCR